MTVRGGLRWQPGLKTRLRSYKTWLKSLELTLLRRILVLTNFKKRNDELTSLLNKEKEDAVVEFRAFKQFIDFLDTNYVAGFEDFCMDAMENFHEVDLGPLSSTLVLLQALSSRRALKILTLKMMPPISLPKMTQTLEMTPFNENVKF